MKTRSIAAAAVAILAVVAIVLTIIGYFGIHRRKGPAPTQTATASSAPIDVHGGSIQAFYDQGITWGKCAPGTFDSYRGVDSSDPSEYQCAFLKAPLDWDNPDGDQISLALAIHRSGKKDAPALFVNPGGPGGAVVSALPYYAGQGIGEAVVNAYDIVALDPRGVGDSTPVFCMTDAEKDKYNAGSETEGTDADSPQSAIAEVQEDSREFAQGCRDHSGAIFEHIDTVSAARDFDMVRSILGQDKLNLLGPRPLPERRRSLLHADARPGCLPPTVDHGLRHPGLVPDGTHQGRRHRQRAKLPRIPRSQPAANQ